MYKLILDSFSGVSTSAVNLDTGVSFPFAPGNADYDEYAAWLKAGGVPFPADVVEPLPPKAELPPVEDIDSMGLEEVKGVLKALVERAG